MSGNPGGYNYGLYSQPSQNQVNPYDNFTETLKSDPTPNFLWYTLHNLEKHSYSQQADCFLAIRKSMEKEFKIEKGSPWEAPTPPKE
uniref:Uncharacterized protein n=1 Tax=Marseillevirus LCMAC101 TaxID=2506602 RepID=A0A481YS35_9VIRU|nr:MAG: hypothetical protein LCMAC101_05930 [Marseillevirus LCMAC101]